MYLTPEEREELSRQAASLGISLSAYLRWRVRASRPDGGTTSTSPGVTFHFHPAVNEAVQGRDVK